MTLRQDAEEGNDLTGQVRVELKEADRGSGWGVKRLRERESSCGVKADEKVQE